MKNDLPMTRTLFLLIVLSSFRVTILGQYNVNSRIFLRATTSVVGGEYFIDILLHSDSTKLIFKLKNHIRETELAADTNAIKYKQILKLVKTFISDNDTVKTYSAKLDSIYISYTIYDTDSLIVPNSKNKNYLKLIRKVLISPTEILENKNHFVLDGTRMSFSLIDNGIRRIVYAQNPTSSSHPILYRLITETTNLYRKNKTNSFLSKHRTNGY